MSFKNDERVIIEGRTDLLSNNPVTLKGKAKVAGNAITHGLSAEKHVIVGESLAEFKIFKDSMFQIYEPEGAYE